MEVEVGKVKYFSPKRSDLFLMTAQSGLILFVVLSNSMRFLTLILFSSKNLENFETDPHHLSVKKNDQSSNLIS